MPTERVTRSPRVTLSLQAVLVDSDGGELPIEILNLSKDGFRVRAGEPLLLGEKIHLRVSRYGDFAAVIQWVQGYEAGGEFLEPMHTL